NPVFSRQLSGGVLRLVSGEQPRLCADSGTGRLAEERRRGNLDIWVVPETLHLPSPVRCAHKGTISVDCHVNGGGNRSTVPTVARKQNGPLVDERFQQVLLRSHGWLLRLSYYRSVLTRIPWL